MVGDFLGNNGGVEGSPGWQNIVFPFRQHSPGLPSLSPHPPSLRGATLQFSRVAYLLVSRVCAPPTPSPSGPSSVELTDDSLVAQHSRPLIALKRSCFGETPSCSSREP